MNKTKMIYDAEIFKKVIYIFGSDSQICKAMVAGEKISWLIRDSIKKKGVAFRIKEKKDLLKKCREVESYFELKQVDEQNI